MPTTDEAATVYVVDDDAPVRTALVRLMRSAHMTAVPYASVDELLAAPTIAPRACVLADIRMQGTSALTLPRLLKGRGKHIPVIFVSAQDSEQTRADAQRAGGAAFFRKPVDGQALVDAIAWALSQDPPGCAPERARSGVSLPTSEHADTRTDTRK